MKTHGYNKNGCLLIGLAIMVAFVAGCDPHNTSGTKCYPCPEAPVREPYIDVRFVDKTTGTDLFFGNHPAYTLSQLKVYHIENGIADSVHLGIDTTDHFFDIAIPTIHNTDTVTLQISGKPQDQLLFKTTTSGSCCISFTFEGVVHNGTLVFDPAKGPDVVVLQE
jgi:hypothetical protein